MIDEEAKLGEFPEDENQGLIESPYRGGQGGVFGDENGGGAPFDNGMYNSQPMFGEYN